MTFITDKVAVKNGADYTFVCSKIPFAVSCYKHLPHEEYNLMDLDLVNRMKIPLQKIKVERCSIMGQTFRSVGFVSQTVQCVRQGKISGNIHITARVVRDLLPELDVDFIASSKTYTRLVGKKPTPPVEPMDLEDVGDSNIEDDGENNLVLSDDEEEDDKPDVEDTKALDVETEAAAKINKITDNKVGGELAIGDIPWDWGYKDVPTVDDLYPSSTPTNHVIQSRVAHSPFIGNKKYLRKSNHYSEEKGKDYEILCKLCFSTGQPLSIVKSHHSLHISCPSMTDDEKEQVYSPNWVARMHGYPT